MVTRPRTVESSLSMTFATTVYTCGSPQGARIEDARLHYKALGAR